MQSFKEVVDQYCDSVILVSHATAFFQANVNFFFLLFAEQSYA